MNRTQKNILAGMLALSVTVLNGCQSSGADTSKGGKGHEHAKSKPREKGTAVRVIGKVTSQLVTENGRTSKVYSVEVSDGDLKGKSVPLYGGPPAALESLENKDARIGGVLINKGTELCVISIASAPVARKAE